MQRANDVARRIPLYPNFSETLAGSRALAFGRTRSTKCEQIGPGSWEEDARIEPASASDRRGGASASLGSQRCQIQAAILDVARVAAALRGLPRHP